MNPNLEWTGRINQPGSLEEWRLEIRPIAVEKMLGLLVNDSPHMTVEDSMRIIDSFLCDKMFAAWGNSESTVVWHESRIEMYVWTYFTHEFRNNVLRPNLVD